MMGEQHNYAARILESNINRVEREIESTMDDLDTLQQSHQDASEHLDLLKQRKDEMVSALRVLQ